MLNVEERPNLRLLINTAIVVLTTFSLSISVRVWTSLSSELIEQGLLLLAAVGIEFTKLALVPCAYILIKQQDDRRVLVTLFAILSLLISIVTMVTYLDQKVTLQGEIADITKRKVDRNLKLDNAIVDATNKYVNQGNVTKDGLRRLQTLQEIANPVMPAMSHEQRAVGYSPLLAVMSGETLQRYAILTAIAATIDIAVAILLLLIVSKQSLPNTKLSVSVQPDIAHCNADCNDSIVSAISDTKQGEAILVTKLMSEFKVRQPEVKQVLDQMIANGTVHKVGNKYYRSDKVLEFKRA